MASSALDLPTKEKGRHRRPVLFAIDHQSTDENKSKYHSNRLPKIRTQSIWISISTVVSLGDDAVCLYVRMSPAAAPGCN